MFGRRSEPKGWQGFSTIKDEDAHPPKPIESWVSRILVPIFTLILAIALGMLAGGGVYFCLTAAPKTRWSWARWIWGSHYDAIVSPRTLHLLMLFGAVWSVCIWARAYYLEKQTRKE
jgi:uncharacterized metal-binding protein